MTPRAGNQTGLGHREHPWLGQHVTDTAHGNAVGILQAVAPDVDLKRRPQFIPYDDKRKRRPIDDERLVAWLRPPGGGVEWNTNLAALREA